jgi:hypothetical protein
MGTRARTTTWGRCPTFGSCRSPATWKNAHIHTRIGSQVTTPTVGKCEVSVAWQCRVMHTQGTGIACSGPQQRPSIAWAPREWRGGGRTCTPRSHQPRTRNPMPLGSVENPANTEKRPGRANTNISPSERRPRSWAKLLVGEGGGAGARHDGGQYISNDHTLEANTAAPTTKSKGHRHAGEEPIPVSVGVDVAVAGAGEGCAALHPKLQRRADHRGHQVPATASWQTEGGGVGKGREWGGGDRVCVRARV